MGACTVAFSTAGLELAQVRDDSSMTAAAAAGVVLAGVDASGRGFETYASGVFAGEGCTDRVDHYVAVVGYSNAERVDHPADESTLEDVAGVGYWILQNSWGVNWGEQGFMRLDKNTTNLCGIYSASFAIQGASTLSLV
jgi:hypothetical protein